MSDYSTETVVNQANNLIFGQNVSFPLEDEKFPWRAMKKQTLKLSELYGMIGEDKYEERAKTCSSWLEYKCNSQTYEKRLHRAGFCQLRLCPLCTKRKARRAAKQLSLVMEYIEEQHRYSGGVQYLFLTLTIQNVTGDKLSEAITDLTSAWSKLRRRRRFERAVKGWFRAIEVNYNKKTHEFHPHIHAILAVEDSYFPSVNGLYITQPEWIKLWRESLQVDYDPSVDIRSTRQVGRPKKQGRKDAFEAAKYCVKSSDFISGFMSDDEAATVVACYTYALKGRRLTAMGGWFKDAMDDLALVSIDDLQAVVYDDDATVGEYYDLLLRFGWSFGVGDYILNHVYENVEATP